MRNAIPQLTDLLIFGDNPSGEMFYTHADRLPNGGQGGIRRILFNDHGASKNLPQRIKDKNVAQGKRPATRHRSDAPGAAGRHQPLDAAVDRGHPQRAPGLCAGLPC